MKNLLLILALIISTSTAFSQVKVRPGVKAGLNFADLTNLENSSLKTGLNGGLFLNVHFTRFYELQLETTYSSQGSSYENGFVYDDYDSYYSNRSTEFNLDYVSLGIANKFFPVQNIGLNIIVGPSIDVLVSSENYYDSTPIDLSFFGGIGYEFPFGLGLEARYKFGIVPVDDSYDNGYYDENGYYNNNYYDNNILNKVIQISATYRFSF